MGTAAAVLDDLTAEATGTVTYPHDGSVMSRYVPFDDINGGFVIITDPNDFPNGRDGSGIIHADDIDGDESDDGFFDDDF